MSESSSKDFHWLERYSRQLLLPEIGYAGQKKLEQKKVLIVGLGGLGAPVAVYLAGAGVGTLGIVDDGLVERSNLHRQIIYAESDIGRPKAIVGAERLSALNPQVTTRAYTVRLTPENARKLVSNYDLVIDGSDNLPTRYLINDACYFEDKPWIYASLYRSYGQLSVFHPPQSPCYRCLFPTAPSAAIPDCSEAGILGPLPGIFGSLQALEALKILLGFGEPSLGSLVSIDGASLAFRRFTVRKNPLCPLCGIQPTITENIGMGSVDTVCATQAYRTGDIADVQESVPPSPAFSTSPHRPSPPLRNAPASETRLTSLHSGLPLPSDGIEVSPAAVSSLLETRACPIVLLDVREAYEVEHASIAGSLWVPLADLPLRVNELPGNAPIIVYCHTGHRSYLAAQWLRENGFPDAYSLAGGIDLWSQVVDPSIPRY